MNTEKITLQKLSVPRLRGATEVQQEVNCGMTEMFSVMTVVADP